MASETGQSKIANRFALAAIGALAGLSFWLLVDVLPDVINNPQLFIFVAAGTLAFFAGLLALAGPLNLRRAAITAASVAIPSAALLTWASLRFDTTEDFFRTGHPLLAFSVLISVPLPFLIAHQRAGERWSTYAALFDHSWNIVVRYAAAWLFVGVVWGVVFLSDALFRIVGLDIIRDLLDIDGVPFVLTGLVLGLAIAVVNELSDYVSPYLILQLLRLLLPVLVVVMAVFIVALPFRGLSGLFGGLSAAATLMGIVIGGVTLVTTAIDKREDDAVDSAFMLFAARAIALMTPVLAILAGYAVFLRVQQYGWTPDRILAALIAEFVIAYAIFYAVAVVMRTRWMARIRSVNVWLALAVVVVSALWLSPLLNPQRISTNSQIARFEAGKTDLSTLDLWSIARDWGRAGERGIERLSAMTDHPEADDLMARLERLENATNRYQFDMERRAEENRNRVAALKNRLPIRPEGADLPDEAFGQVSTPFFSQLETGCDMTTPAGHPGCLVVEAEVLPGSEGREYFVFYMSNPDTVRVVALKAHAGSYRTEFGPVDLANGGTVASLAPLDIDTLAEGDFRIAPSGMKTLWFGDKQLFIYP